MSRAINYILHIPKTAGMSLQMLARRRHKTPGSLELVYTRQHVEEGFSDRPELQTVMGHYRFGYHKFSPKPFRYFTFLRDPVEQVISHYHYTRDHPEKFEYLPEGINSIIDFARCPYGYNLQTLFVSGIPKLEGHEREALQIAKENLVRHFGMIGLTEQFDLSLLMMGKALGWKILYYIKGNTGRARRLHPRLPEKEMNELRKILKYDLELYHFGEMLFENQLNKNYWAAGKLSFFKLKNGWFQRLNPFYIWLKKLFLKVGSSATAWY